MTKIAEVIVSPVEVTMSRSNASVPPSGEYCGPPSARLGGAGAVPVMALKDDRPAVGRPVGFVVEHETRRRMCDLLYIRAVWARCEERACRLVYVEVASKDDLAVAARRRGRSDRRERSHH